MIVGESKRFNYTGSIQSIELLPGIYKLECWGASGANPGYWSSLGGYSHPGNGGYICGELSINHFLVLYIQVGARNGYNGGGYGSIGQCGGGATDIRLISGAWNNLDSLKSRILVAGGGGGDEWGYSKGGAGGNFTGGTGTPGRTSNGQRYCYGGTQTSGGSGYVKGGFGYGGYLNTSTDLGGCGGGGWYGGGSNLYSGGGGGGSSYAAGHPECDNTYHESYQKNIVLQNVNYQQGINNGNGYAIITMLKDTLRKNSNFYKDSYNQETFDFNKLLEV